MKTRIVHTRFWSDNFVCNLSHKEKLLFIYLLTNDKVNLVGMYELPDKYIKADLELTQPELDKAKEKLQKAGKIYFLDGWIRLVNHDKYNSYKGAKTGMARERELTEIPQKLIEYPRGIDTSIHTSMHTPNNHKSETINHKSEIRNHKPYTKIDELKEKDFSEIATKYNCPIAFVRSKYDDMCLWVGEKEGRDKGRNWKLTLMNWVKRDSLQIKQDYAKRNSEVAI